MSSPKSPNKAPPSHPLLTGSRPRQESFSRTAGICIYLRRTPCRIIYFSPGGYSIDTGSGRVEVSLPPSHPSHYFDSRRTNRVIKSLRIPRRAARARNLRVGPISRKNIWRTFIITRSTKFLPPVDPLRPILRIKSRKKRGDEACLFAVRLFFDQFEVYFS